MACICNLRLSHKIRNSVVSSLCFYRASHGFPKTCATPFPSRSLNHSSAKLKCSTLSVSVTGAFTWDDVVRISEPESLPEDSLDLTGFFEKVKICNRGSVKPPLHILFGSPRNSKSGRKKEPFGCLQEKQSEFLPFVMEDQIVGYIHNVFADHLRRFQDVFVFPEDNCYGGRIGHATLHPMLRKPEDRTSAVGDVIKSLAEELIPGIRNELYPVTSSFGARVFFSLERAAAPYFGIKAYGVHMNGYVERDRQKLLWIGKRSPAKATYPGMLDHLAAGGLPHGIACGENLVKECEEEAGIPRSIADKAIPVGAVSYVDIDGYRYKRDVLFCYDLKLPESFRPENQDGEVDSFKLIPVTHVANIIRRTQFFKPNCSLVIMDFLFRHGYFSSGQNSFSYLQAVSWTRT
ncbi:Nudix hydrolase 20, chloroplastic [Morella rubra]|uniref:Nudix hydrolase 20, chloroplastic n=1 Tax=Morella rubra TaxID=262757 RepID=A0A6A1UMI6_9ROSI|nr:Nudix hydrolase 20, chloroplastic [Morella rubra]